MTSAPPGPPRDMVGYNGKPPTVTWPGGARVAIAMTVCFIEGSEMAIGDGDPLREPGWYPAIKQDERDLAQEGMWEYGTRAGVWRLLAAFAELDVPVTFFASAVALERHPRLAAELRPAGHDVIAHGYRYEDPSLLSVEDERERISLAVESITKTTGQRPLGWFSRHAPSPSTRELLVAEGGFCYDSDSFADDFPYWTVVNGTKHLVIPFTMANSDQHFDDKWFGSPLDFERHLRENLDQLLAEGETSPKLMNVAVRAHVAGHPGRTKALRNFMAYATAQPGVWFARRIEIANHWMEHHA